PPISTLFPYTTLFRSSYILIIPVLTTMRLDSIMVMQRGAKEIRNLFSGILLISFVTTSLIVLVMLILNQLGWVDFHLPVSILLRSEEHTSELQSRENL